MHALQLLKSHGVDTNILTVVTADTAKNYRNACNFFVRSGFDYQQYVPCLDPLSEPRGQQPWSLTPVSYTHLFPKLQKIGGQHVPWAG